MLNFMLHLFEKDCPKTPNLDTLSLRRAANRKNGLVCMLNHPGESTSLIRGLSPSFSIELRQKADACAERRCIDKSESPLMPSLKNIIKSYL